MGTSPATGPSNHKDQGAHWIVRLNHRVRSATFVFVFVLIGSHLWAHPQQASPLAWGLLGLQFLLYPHLVYLAGARSQDPKATEMRFLLLDPLLMGAWIAWLGFPLWIGYPVVMGTLISIGVYRGIRGMAEAGLADVAGALLWIAFDGLRFQPQTATLTTTLGMLALTTYLLQVGLGYRSRSIKLHDAREALRRNEQALQQHIQEIQTLQQQLREQATRDGLTGLYNRRYLDDALEREIASAEREQRPLSLLIADIDHFKPINDTHGHQTGDEVLRHLAQQLQQGARASDIVCRYGGEEFVVLLPNTPLEAAVQKAEFYRAQLADNPITLGGLTLTPTLSIGVATCPDHARDPDHLVQQADAALYRAKAQGRNRVERGTANTG